MKMKIFKGGDVRVLESKINEWLQAEGIGLIHHVTHTNDGSLMVVTVWWGD
jgi:hypothetical protein